MYTSSLPDHCTPTTTFLTNVSTFFHTCIPTGLAFLSTILGCLSILSWLFAQLPQIYKNYTLKSASGLSIFFLAEWLLGDFTNLLGALFTKQATWQVVVPGYYVFVDLFLFFQYLWYSQLNVWRQRRLEDQRHETVEHDDEGASAMIIEVSPPENPTTASEPAEGKDATMSSKPREARANPFRTLNFSFSPKEKKTSSSYRTGNPASGAFGPSPRTVLFISMLLAVLSNASPLHTIATPTGTPPPSLETAGRILSWASTVLYLGSRLPQLYKNHVRRSTAGLSPILFVAAFFGNLFYSTSILTNPLGWKSYGPYGLNGWAGPQGSDRVVWASLEAPFWLGAAGVLFLDSAVGVQFLQYREEKKVIVVTDQRGRSRWRRVSGWMRGWVPSPSPKREDIEEENEQPLLQREIGRDGGYGAA